jgi:predicted RNase H-like nuclease (RuvC/YqgF family)
MSDLAESRATYQTEREVPEREDWLPEAQAAAVYVDALEAEVERLTESRSVIARGLEREEELNADLEAEVERLNRHRDELAADKHRLLKEVRALDEQVERLREAHVETTAELLWYRAIGMHFTHPLPAWWAVEPKDYWRGLARATLAGEGDEG